MGGGRLNGLALQVTPEQADHAKRLVASATFEAVRLIHVRAAHMTAPGCPVRNAEGKPLPTATASLLSDTNRFRVLVQHVMHLQREAKASAEVQVDATLELVYSYPADSEPPSPQELQAFADTNALMNCWPYWRELVQNMVGRMNLPPFVVPLLRYVPQPPKKTEPDVSQKTGEVAPAGG
jgi:hypothetical protein